MFCLLLLISCSYRGSEAYRDFYKYSTFKPCEPSFSDSPYYIVFLVNARHLDYSSSHTFLKTIAKHPFDGSMNGDVGHAWIYLKGETILEGGHSGELGIDQPKYWEGVVENIELGSENPIAYLFAPLCDGYFQSGNGGHKPTYAVKVSLTKEEHEMIVDWITHYDFREYALQGAQCASFVTKIAALIGIDLEDQVSVPIDSSIKLAGQVYTLWKDPKYSKICFSSPDCLEKSLMKLVVEGSGEYALGWYQRAYPTSAIQRISECLDSTVRLKERWQRYCLIE